MEEDLMELDAMFEEIGGNDGAEELANGFQGLPDGTYEAEIIGAEYTKSKAGKDMIKIEYGTDYNGQHHWQYLSLVGKDEAGTKRNISRAVTVLRQLGLEADKFSGYVAQLEQLEGKGVTITLETKKEYQNTHIDDVH